MRLGGERFRVHLQEQIREEKHKRQAGIPGQRSLTLAQRDPRTCRRGYVSRMRAALFLVRRRFSAFPAFPAATPGARDGRT